MGSGAEVQREFWDECWERLGTEVTPAGRGVWGEKRKKKSVFFTNTEQTRGDSSKMKETLDKVIKIIDKTI